MVQVFPAQMSPTRIPSRVLAMGSIVATAALWGASTPLVKQLVDTVPPCTLAAMRLAIALAVLLPVLALQGRRPRVGWTEVLLGLTGVAASQVLQNLGMAHMPAGPAVIVLLAGTVVLTTGLGWAVLGERCSLPVMLAMVGCAAGVALVAVAGGGALAFPIEGMLLILGSAGAWAIYAVLGRRANDTDPAEVTAGALLVGLIVLLPLVAYERPTEQTLSMGAGDLLALVVLGTLVTAGSYLCFAYGIRHLQASEASVLCSVEPAFGLVFAWLLLGEGLSAPKAIGAAVIVASCLLVALGESELEPQGFPLAAEAV
ncbi:MAG TPA: DMT family transporter [Thermomicrobiales bacterium]|nr:DMT family transporter [Thermomicrobiales bacterium]